MDEGELYDPPIIRRRSNSSASVNPPLPKVIQSDFHSDTSSSVDGDTDDDDASRPLVDVSTAPTTSARKPAESVPLPSYKDQLTDYDEDKYEQDDDFYQDYKSPKNISVDDQMDLKTQRPGRMSKGWEKPGTTHSSDAEGVLAQVCFLFSSLSESRLLNDTCFRSTI